ncbi:hypothetical protein J4209_00105 [Candidatus Woesearchaeota archaeon]|nr:hypothetical protein [Candidatus Woesearchaeota archaeon]
MNDPRLDQYIDRVVEYLKRSNYKNKDIKDSFNKAIPKPAKQNIFFLILCCFFSLILAIIISSVIVLGSVFLEKGYLLYLPGLVFLGSIAFLSYFGFSSFNIKERTILIITFSISTLTSLSSSALHFFVGVLLKRIEQSLMPTSQFLEGQTAVQGLVSLFGEPVNILIVVVAIFVLYNILPLIFLLTKSAR